jgi:uncharacterized membrane protein
MVAFVAARSPARHLPASNQTCASQKNVGDAERVASVIGGGLMILNAIPSRPISALLLGGFGAALVYRGITGHCECYKALGISTRNAEGRATAVPAQYGFKYEKSLVINRGAHELFDFWRNLENLPRIMPHLTSVIETGGSRSHWVATGPMGVEVEWDAEVYNEEPGRLIAWRSLPGGDVNTAGAVHFEEHGAGKGTEVRVSLKYNPPMGRVGANLAWLLGSGVEQEIDGDLRRFRQMMESGSFFQSRRQLAGRAR